VQVAFDVADGLNYLHDYTKPPYVHKNLNSQNVLLDRDFKAKPSNFGLARAVNGEVFIDPCLEREHPLNLAFAMADLAMRCMARVLEYRNKIV
jgi:serine/threonine protein kinase